MTVAGNESKIDARIDNIVVAVDGSPAAMAVLAWAEAEARTFAARSGPPRLLVYRLYPQAGAPAIGPDEIDYERLELLDPIFARELRGVRERLGDDRVELVVRTGVRRRELGSLVTDRDLLATPAFGSGTLAAAIASRSSATVVAVRPTDPPEHATAGPFAGHVLLGVGDGASARRAAMYAFDFAARHHKPLVAIRGAEANRGGVWVDDESPEVHQLGHEFGLDLVEASIAEAQASQSDVPVRRAVLRDPAGPALVRASAGATLLVVGDRGRSAVARRMLGSVSRHVLMNAHCPVAVARLR